MTKNSLELMVAVAILGGIGGYMIAPHADRDTYVAKVTGKEIKRYSEGSDKYLIFTELPDKSTRVFENTDSPLELKYNSFDLYGKMQIGKTYEIKTYGWRIPSFSWYENITDAKVINNKDN